MSYCLVQFWGLHIPSTRLPPNKHYAPTTPSSFHKHNSQYDNLCNEPYPPPNSPANPIVLVHNGESETNKLLHNVFVTFHNQSELIATQGQRLAHVENGETLNPSSRNFGDGRIIPNIF